jgi:hypothetical protein
MDQPNDDRDRGTSALRVAGVSLGLLGATFGGVAGWFTLASSSPATSAAVVSTRTGSVESATEATTLGLGNGRPHTRTGGA